MPVLVRMPELITGISEAVLLSWMVNVGDILEEGTPLAEVETDKAVVEYLAESSGTMASLLVQPGQPVPVGEPIAILAEAGESVSDAVSTTSAEAEAAVAESAEAEAEAASAGAEVSAQPEPDDPPRPDGGAATATPNGTRRFATPLVRKLARERGIDLATMHGSGPNGRIVRRDLESPRPTAPSGDTVDNVAESTTPAPTSTPSPRSQDADHTDVELTPMRRTIARRLTESKATVPHFYLQADCRVDALLDLRRTLNTQLQHRLSLNDFVIKAVGHAFASVPDANAVWNGTTIRRYERLDVGVAVSIEGGLVTPVIRDVARKTVGAIGSEARDLAGRAREGRLKQSELEGGSFCISNLGMYDVERFAAIINPPQSGILAVGTATQRPVVTEGQLGVATVMSVTLSGDHRVFDGALGAQWLTAFVAAIEQPMTMLV